jgi:hypothetical protein
MNNTAPKEFSKMKQKETKEKYLLLDWPSIETSNP